jgi:nitrile hydratase
MSTTQPAGSPAPVAGSFPASEEEIAARVKALESLMIEKGMTSELAVDKIAELYEREVGPHNGARIVARAWTDPEFKQRLLEDATAASAELGIGGIQGEDMVVVENTDDVHNAIVCTLCSCYPWPTLGLPPNWYKYPAYRARMVKEPRTVLRDEFGVELPEDKEVRIWDTSAEVRYWVLPQRPPGTEDMSEEELRELVTRDSMIGVGTVPAPGA